MILVVALMVLGPQRLPEVARSVGKGMRELQGLAPRESATTIAYATTADELEEGVQARTVRPAGPPVT